MSGVLNMNEIALNIVTERCEQWLALSAERLDSASVSAVTDVLCSAYACAYAVPHCRWQSWWSVSLSGRLSSRAICVSLLTSHCILASIWRIFCALKSY